MKCFIYFIVRLHQCLLKQPTDSGWIIAVSRLSQTTFGRGTPLPSRHCSAIPLAMLGTVTCCLSAASGKGRAGFGVTTPSSHRGDTRSGVSIAALQGSSVHRGPREASQGLALQKGDTPSPCCFPSRTLCASVTGHKTGPSTRGSCPRILPAQRALEGRADWAGKHQ